jgi:hypothetical protein
MNREGELSKTEEIVLMATMIADGAWEKCGSSRKESLEWLAQYVKVLEFKESEDIATVIRKEIYLTMRNVLMATRRGDLFYLQNHPTFSNWSRKNLTELALAYSRGGESLLRETLARIFHDGWTSERPDLTIIGFDENLGTSETNAIRIYNAPSAEDGVEAEYWYLHYRFGIAHKDWKLSMQTLLEDRESGKAHDLLGISFPDGSSREVYFDISEFYGC